MEDAIGTMLLIFLILKLIAKATPKRKRRNSYREMDYNDWIEHQRRNGR